MATRQDIIDVIDAYLEDKMTLDEAVEWTEREISKTDPCEDPAFVFFTFLGSDAPEEVRVRPLKEQLLLDREVLVRGVPCPHKELGKTIEAYWLAFAPREKIVLCQIRITEDGERILEVIEEGWDGTQLFHEEKPLPIKDRKSNSPLTWEEIKRKTNWRRIGFFTGGTFLQWVVDQLQKESTVRDYQDLLSIYWRLRRPNAFFLPEYIKAENKTRMDSITEELMGLMEILREEDIGRKTGGNSSEVF
ncbi:MAG: hypothetical protein HXS41_03150 [Theionarchaea archaeon]|nr:hypothetical protein [Theionarchaea archaeon]MBU7000440.1 hypothetical protein [Theionarchaea archaeon]MBU7020033.1 hypothetical protein [Theionarchaea archaeon]MBU7035908.1 hypothetical protein [Theionarchaea archaeon]